MQFVCLSFNHHGVAGIVSSLIARYHICFLSQQVDDLSFAFIAPLGSHNSYC